MTVSASDFLRHLHYLPPEGRRAVEYAIEKATQYHEGQFRGTGQPYITHPLAVADYLTRLEADVPTLSAALLHDVVEDECASEEEIEKEFGLEIARLVAGVTKLTKIHYEGRRGERQVASLRKLLLSASDDLRVIVIKLADRWHNIETIGGLRPDKQMRVANETLDIYVPFAKLMGLYALKSRFEDICFPIALPDDAVRWQSEVERIRSSVESERQAFIARIDAETATTVCPDIVRTTDYELYTKCQGNIDRLKNTQSIDSVVLVVDSNTTSSCYEVLGQVHSKYPVRALSFKDYISVPQPNGYRALHTTIFLSKSHELLLRIQTKAMFDFVQNRKMSSWLSDASPLSRTLSSLTQLPFHHDQFLSDLKTNVLADRMNIFTTAGDVVSLPQGATGIDLAFAINPDTIKYLAAVRVNGEVREVTTSLFDGDTVEPVLYDDENPAMRTTWVEKARSVEAREALKENLSSMPIDQQSAEGYSVLTLECRKRALPLWWLMHLSRLQHQLAMNLAQPSFRDVLSRIGTGEILVSRVADVYRDILSVSPTLLQKFLKLFLLMPRSRQLHSDTHMVTLELRAVDRKGLIYDISRCIAERDINIADFRVYALPPKDALYRMRVEFDKFHDYSNLFDSLLEIPSVKEVKRTR